MYIAQNVKNTARNKELGAAVLHFSLRGVHIKHVSSDFRNRRVPMIYVLNFGYLFMLIALMIRNILFLRIILISAQSIFIAYGLVTANYVVVVWNSLFIVLNVFQVVVLLRRRMPVTIPTEIEDIYDSTFHDMSKREFFYFWQIGNEVDYEPGIIVKEGSPQNSVMLMLQGSASVEKNGKDIAELARGSFIAEMSFLSEDPASADVSCYVPVKVMTWDRDNLLNLKRLNFELWMKIQHVLSKDLVGKVKQASSRLHDRTSL